VLNNNKKIKNTLFLFPLFILSGTLLNVFVAMEYTIPGIFAQDEREQQQQQQQSSSSSIMLTAKLVDNQYRWTDTNSNVINPTLNITSGGENQITIKSVKGDPEEHELIIEGISSNAATTAATIDNEGKGEELVASEEIEDGSSTSVHFNPGEIQEGNRNYQSFEYYCEYHPDTMRGKVQIK
jgi:hypothetical protein